LRPAPAALPELQPVAVPPTHASEPQVSKLSPTWYDSPFGQVHVPLYVPTPDAPSSTELA
jgi:hypothetical protein